MSPLQALCTQYERLLARGEPGLPEYGYSAEKISYCIELSVAGDVLNVLPLLDSSGKKPMPRTLNVPQPEKRTSGVKPNVLWDKTSYVLGVSASSKRMADEHAAFKQQHALWLNGESDEGLRALQAFLSAWQPERFQHAPFHADMIDENLVFRLEGEHRFLHERPAARALRARLLAGGEGDTPAVPMMCLVSGETAPVARLHPAIKGVNGAQSSGASIVSFNQESFNSWGKAQGENAPLSEAAAFAYTAVLNHLLRRDPSNRQRVGVGDATVVFWAESDQPDEVQAAEAALNAFLHGEGADTDDQAVGKMHGVMEVLASGRPITDLDPRLNPGTRMCVLGLAPNASRLSIRYWLRESLGVLAERIRQHAQDLHLEPVPWKAPPTPWRLALITAPSRDGKHKQDDVSPLLAGELMRSILTGQRYPHTVLVNLLMRMRADGDISGLRVALCKAVLARHMRLSSPPPSTHLSQELPVSLDVDHTHPGYLLGRLFATLESVQRLALGKDVNATIRDRYFGAASATPALVFPMLVRNAQNHLARLRKDKVGLAINLEKDIREVMDKLPPHFPKTLVLEDQGRFAIGYYHQSQAQFSKADKREHESSDAAATA